MAVFHEINKIITSLTELSNIGICFYDLENFYKFSINGNREYIGHYCEFCKNVRMLEKGRSNCERSDRHDALELAKIYRQNFFFKCHMGMCELIVPIFYEDKLIGVFFVGQCRVEGETSAQEIGSSAEALGGSFKNYTALYNSLPLVNRSTLLAVGDILKLYFKNLSIDELSIKIPDNTSNYSLAERVMHFIRQNYMYKITPNSLAKIFYVNQSYLSRAFHEKYGCTVTYGINMVRCENALRLIKNTSLPINNIALNVGYSDANYFSRVFKCIYGCTPSAYNEKHK